MGIVIGGVGLGWILGATAVSVGSSVYTSNRTAAAAEDRQDQLIEYQDEQVRKAELKQTEAEKKIALSEAEATKSAADTLKKRKQAITKTVFTSPLGLSDEATVGKKSLLGG